MTMILDTERLSSANPSFAMRDRDGARSRSDVLRSPRSTAGPPGCRPRRTTTPSSGLDPALAAARWNDAYRQGRYLDDPPLPFVADILATLRARPAVTRDPGLYIGCGNGRSLLPLLDAGLRLHGLDLSVVALRMLARRRPDVAGRLVCGAVRHCPFRGSFGYLVAIQVFQHGSGIDAATYFRQAADLLAPGGLLFLRVNSVATEIGHTHRVLERNAWGGLTIEYGDGPKRGLAVHFYARDELAALTEAAFRPASALREVVMRREPPRTGTWAQ